MRIYHVGALLLVVLLLAGIPGLTGITPRIENEPWGVTRYVFAYTLDVSNFGTAPARSVEARVALMHNFDPFQRVESITAENQSYTLYVDELGNRYANYSLPEIPPGASFTANFTAEVSIFSIDFSDGFTTQSPDPVYVAPEPFVESANPRIVNRSLALWASSSGLSDYSYRSYVWTTEHLTYETQPQERGALWALRTGRGMCYEYSNLYIALLRTQGLAAKRVNGWGDNFFTGNIKYAEEIAHAWALVYTANHGWIPVDPTFGDLHLFENYLKITDLHIILTEGINRHFYRVTYDRTAGTNVQVDYTVHVLSKVEQNLSLTRQIVLVGMAAVPVMATMVIVSQVVRERRRRVYND